MGTEQGTTDASRLLSVALQLHKAGQFAEAEHAYRQILATDPNNSDALQLLGTLAAQGGRRDVAVELIRRAISIRPDFHQAYNNLGNVLKEQRLMEQAVVAFERAIALKPDFAEAHNNLGNALAQQGLRPEAIACYNKAIALKPGFAQAHYNLANAFREGGRLDEATAAYTHALQLSPNLVEAHHNLGTVLRDTGHLQEAIAAFRRALSLKPDYVDAHSNIIHAISLDEAFNAPAVADELRRWNHRHAEPFKAILQPHLNDRNATRPLRIGYVSADFRTHASANFLAPLLKHHNPAVVDVFCYSEVARPDEVTSHLRQRVPHWHDTVGSSDAELAERIRADRIDILVDLKLHTDGNRLLVFARKPAPVQATWLGYPGSTGLTTVDYRLSDPYLDPPGRDESIYSEQTIRLPHSFWCYDPLDGQDLAINALPVLASGIVTFGCLNAFFKIREKTLILWAQVLRLVGNSRLQLLVPEGSSRRRVLDILKRERVDSARIELVSRAPRHSYLRRYHTIDIALDTYPCNGHTTSLDSMWMGVPIVTLVGQSAMSRAGWCQLSNLGLADLAAWTPEQYVQIAADLAHDLPRLRELRSTLRQRMKASPLMDAPAFAKDIEAAYRQMWQDWCARTSPV